MAKLAALQLRSPQKALAIWADQCKEDLTLLKERIDPESAAYDGGYFRHWIGWYQRYVLEQVQKAGEAGAELVLLPEGNLPTGDFMKRRLIAQFREVCRWSTEEYLAAIAPLARRYHMAIASCLYYVDDGLLVNAGILTGINGEIAGIYHKTHLPCYEDEEVQITEAGVFAAGSTYPVFETPVGTVGFMICYDVIFPEVARILALSGADILLHPSVGYNFPDEEEIVGEARLRIRATENSASLIYANFSGAAARSCVVDRRGTMFACGGRSEETLVIADVDLHSPRLPDWVRSGYEHREHIWRKRRPDTYGLLLETKPPVLDKLHEPKTESLYHYCDDVPLP